MACPFFTPLQLIEWGGRAPLGGMFNGSCSLGGAADEPRLCNFGYARSLCDHFPADSHADAVRFSVSGMADGILRIVWILEKDHAPVDHGSLEYRESAHDFIQPPTGPMASQARIFVEAYLRR
jgi:hypothetical protein